MALRWTLTEGDLELAARWARSMTDRAWARGYRHHDYGAPTRRLEASYDLDLAQRVRALAAEIAVARLLRQPWHDPDHQSGPASPDVGLTVGVRWSARPRLFIRPRDPDDHRFYLVTGDPPELVLHGSILAAEAKVDCWWVPFDPAPAWVLPPEALTPVDAPGRPE